MTYPTRLTVLARYAAIDRLLFTDRLTVEQIATEVGCCPKTVRRYVDDLAQAFELRIDERPDGTVAYRNGSGPAFDPGVAWRASMERCG